MKIQATNQINFGIKYKNKKAWDKKVLAEFEKSRLLRDLNKKYPNAEIFYKKFFGEESFNNQEIIHTLILDIKLAKDKFFRWNLSSHNENFPEKHLLYELKILTLKDIENGSAEMLAPLSTENAKQKQNCIKAFLKKLFSL